MILIGAGSDIHVHSEREYSIILGLTDADGSRVAMLRFGKGGGAGTQLLIEKGRRNLCHYETGFGSMTLGVTADEIDCQLTEKGGTARFAYLLDADSAELVSRNRLEVTVTHVN